MKFLTVGDYNFEDQERLMESWKNIIDERSKNPDKWVKVLFEAHTLVANLSKRSKDSRVVAIFEADSEEQLINQFMQYTPYMDFQFIPMIDARKVTELWMGWKR